MQCLEHLRALLFKRPDKTKDPKGTCKLRLGKTRIPDDTPLYTVPVFGELTSPIAGIYYINFYLL